MYINSIDKIFIKRLEEIFQKKNTTNAFAHQLKLAEVISSKNRFNCNKALSSLWSRHFCHFCCLRHRALCNEKLKHRTDALYALAQEWQKLCPEIVSDLLTAA
uniref:Uncharacterized protein n=1 Tax=Glossina pallidipes TaxID=7398 RepID=A0A1A9ZNA1_GLOPL